MVKQSGAPHIRLHELQASVYLREDYYIYIYIIPLISPQTWAQVFFQLSGHSSTNIYYVSLGSPPVKEVKDAQLGNLGLQDRKRVY